MPKCADGVPGCARGADGTWVHTIKGTYTGGGRLSAAHFHCHAPSCLSVAMYRCNASVAKADCSAETGELLCEERPVYGGHGASDAKFDEPGRAAATAHPLPRRPATRARPRRREEEARRSTLRAELRSKCGRYIFQPPCLWGKPEHGLAEPPQTDGYTLHSVKTSNASYGHHGEMAWQQMYVF